MAVGVHEALRCPIPYKCADTVVFQYDPVYELEPTYVTSDQVHTSKTVCSPLIPSMPRGSFGLLKHADTHDYVQDVRRQSHDGGRRVQRYFSSLIHQRIPDLDNQPVVAGLCEQWVPTTIKTRPTLTVWRDVTTTTHYYSSVVETEELTHTHTVTQTSACMREIDRRPLSLETSPPLNMDLFQSPRGQGSLVDDLTGDLTGTLEKEAEEAAGGLLKQVVETAAAAAIPGGAAAVAGVKAGVAAGEAVQSALKGKEKESTSSNAAATTGKPKQ